MSLVTQSEELLELPAATAADGPGVWPVRAVSAVDVALRVRRSPAELDPLFHGDEILRVRMGGANWYFGRSAAWTKHVAGSHRMWADLDILPLGLRTHPTYYAMGGLPGAPPGVHTELRKLALASSFRKPVAGDVIGEARELALELAVDRERRRIDVRTLARALCLRASAAALCGIDLGAPDLVRVLGWFDRWSDLIARQLALISLPRVPFGPARQLRGVLAEWYAFLRRIIESGGDRRAGLVPALGERIAAGDMTPEQAAGYLATILFAGTEPPAQTLQWGYAHAVAFPPAGGWAGIGASEAEDLLWESFRVQPAVSYLIRRLAAGPERYESSSNDVFVIAPPLTHRHSNRKRELPLNFTPGRAADGRLDPSAYPGLGTGAHYCIGARFGMTVIRDALAWLLDATQPDRSADTTPVCRVMAQPKRLPLAVLR